MHHFRGKLFQGDKLCLDPANAYVDYDSTGTGANADWSGYLLIKSEKDVVPGGIYTLKLEDGRTGNLLINTVSPEDPERFRAMFVGEGPLG
jgi:hypothetical protein